MANCIANFHGRDFVPIRAIPNMTADQIPAESVPKLLSCSNPYFSAQAYEVQGTTLHEIDAANWKIYAATLSHLVNAGANREELIAALPAGIVVPKNELDATFETCFVDPCVTGTARDSEFITPDFLVAPIANPLMSASLHEVVMQGITPTPAGKTPRPRNAMRLKTDHDPILQDRANACAEKHMETHGKWPSKQAVATELARRDGGRTPVATYCRRIRNEWAKR